MPDIAATDVTYTRERVVDKDGLACWTGSVAFGDGALTYPTGGIPADKGQFGFARFVDSFLITESNGNGFVYEYDKSAETIRILQGDNNNASDGPLVELAGGSATPAAATLQVTATGK